MKVLLTGNEAAAEAVRLARAQVIAAYPITPQTSLAEKLASLVASGALAAEYLTVESEISALAASIGGSLAGARAFTATSSQGLALMHELLHWASGARLPIVLVNVNRSLAAPWSLGIDQTDSLAQRDTGWLQLYCSTAQEVLDSVLIAFKLAEATSLPAMVCLDGFLLSHYQEPVEVPDLVTAARFMPPRRAAHRLDPAEPCAMGGGVSAEALLGFRRRLHDDLRKAAERFEGICRTFARSFGRRYRAVETYGARRGELALVTSGASADTARAYLEESGETEVGLLQVRLFRPFPAEELRRAAAGFRHLVVLDRNLSPGIGGIFGQEIRAALSGWEDAPAVRDVIAGLGGVDLSPEDLSALVARFRSGELGGADPVWLEPAP